MACDLAGGMTCDLAAGMMPASLVFFHGWILFFRNLDFVTYYIFCDLVSSEAQS